MTRFVPVLLVATAAFTANPSFGQVVIQHLGANDPLTEGFFLWSIGPDAQVGPIFDDMDFNAWSIDKGSAGTHTYRYDLSTQEQQAAATNGWMLSGRMRLVEPGIGLLRFVTGTGDFFFEIWLRESGDIEIWRPNNLIYTLVGGGHDYHEYSVVYDAVDQAAALWITGIGKVADLSGGGSQSVAFMSFGAGQGSTHVHWNEATLTIIPEPTTSKLLGGMGVLLVVACIRRRKRKAELKA